MDPKFDWDEANLSHIAEHGVTPAEAEQVIFDDPRDLEVQMRSGEERTVNVGVTDAGRILVVVTTSREGKVRVVTAFTAKKKIRDVYEREKEKDYSEAAEPPGIP